MRNAHTYTQKTEQKENNREKGDVDGKHKYYTIPYTDAEIKFALNWVQHIPSSEKLSRNPERIFEIYTKKKMNEKERTRK